VTDGPFPGASRYRLEVGITGLQRPSEWDAVVLAEAPTLAADEAEFIVLADGTLLGDPGAGPLVHAVPLEPPFSAHAVRKDGSLFSVGANSIEVAELPAHVVGDQIELTVRGGERTVTVDGMRSFAAIPELEALGDRYAEYVVRAVRLGGNTWEVDVEAL
jgi:hypothetical protein